MKDWIISVSVILMFSCEQNKLTFEELEFVQSRAWVRSDPGGFSTAMFHFDSLTEPPFKLESDTLFDWDGEFKGIISSVDTNQETLILRSMTGSEWSNYKKTNRRK